MNTIEEIKEMFKAGNTISEAHMNALIDACYNNDGLQANGIGVFAALVEPSDTVIDTPNEYFFIQGEFTNVPMSGFEFIMVDSQPAIRYIGTAPIYFEVDAHASFSASQNGTTIWGAIKKNGSLVDESKMASFAKYGNDIVNFSGTSVVLLEQNDTIQMCVTANKAETITFVNLTATIRPFLYANGN